MNLKLMRVHKYFCLEQKNKTVDLSKNMFVNNLLFYYKYILGL